MKAIIFSGGMDSATLLYERREEIALAITFDYGSKHNDREYGYAKALTQELCIEHIRIPIREISKYFRSDLLEGGGSIPHGHYAESNMKKTVVPFRNGVMLSIAVGIAESNDLDAVLIANHFGDHAIYPDCRSGFIRAMDEAARFGTYEGIRIEAPYAEINKTDIARIGKRLGIDYSKTWSCYEGGEIHCGRCGTCVERLEALHDAGIDDKTVYADPGYWNTVTKTE